MEANEPIGVHELLVPIMQGIDSLMLNAHIEVGGNDQLFNFQVSRKLQELNEQKPQHCVLCPIINGTDGRKMSKSFDNCIFLDEPAEQIYGKVMSISDQTMFEWLPLFAAELHHELKAGKVTPPMELKKQLAGEIVAGIYDTEAAEAARNHFEGVVQNKTAPEEIPEVKMNRADRGFLLLADAVKTVRQCSHSEAIRLIEQGGVRVNGEPIGSKGRWETIEYGDVIRVGKRQYAKVVE
jgi:tyrosyl-tRNA synthetase